jgi:hypothetical protein
MNIFKKLGPVTIAALWLVSITGSPSSAAFDAAEAKCRSTIAKTFTKAISQGNKAVTTCHKGRNSGKIGIGIDCNVLDLANADPKGKFDKAQAKLLSGVQKTCIDSGIDLDALTDYTSCPEPCGTNLALPNPMTSYANLSACLSCVAGEIAEDYGVATLGLPAASMPAADQTCHSAIGKTYGKLLSTIYKERTKCQNNEEKKNGAMSLSTTGCATADPKLKIAGALTKAEAAVDTSCAGANLTNVDSCDTAGIPTLKTCLDTETDTAGDDGVFGSYELASTVCPIGIDSLVLGKVSEALGATDTALELGWTGTAHLADLPDNYFISVDVTCPNSSPPCGSCTIDGISPTGEQYQSFTRCSNDFTIECDEPFGPDLDDCGGNACNYVLGPPLAISAGNNPTCSINRLALDVTGTSDPDTGTGEIALNLSTLVFLGEGLSNPCPVCVGDVTDLDGVKNGTCSGGANNGDPCDVMGYSASFANAADDEGVSLDCPPEQLSNISGSGLKIGLELTTGASSLAFENSCDSPLGAFDCACGVCNGDTTLPCRNDTECSNAGAGTCTSFGSGVARQPNECGDLTCTQVGLTEMGTCLAGPTDMFCDGQLDSSGDGYIGCTSNADCLAVSSVCDGNDCGNCLDSRQRACFIDPINAVGNPSTENPTLVSTFCLPPTNNAAINGVTGSPGPVRVSVEQLTTLRY